MLKTQEYLRAGKTFAALQAEFAIKSFEHPTAPLVGFVEQQSQSQSQSLSTVRDRGVYVLDRNTLDGVANGFIDQTGDRDGRRVVLLFWYRGEWHVFGEAGFGLGEPWREEFFQSYRTKYGSLPHPNTYTFTIKTNAAGPSRLSLVSVFDNAMAREWPGQWVDILADLHGLNRGD
jgi:hypothetical protein